MSGPKAGLGRVEREGETARRFPRSLPGPLPPFLTAILEPDFRNMVSQTLLRQSQFLIRLPSCKLGPFVGQNSVLGMHHMVHAV